MMKRIGIAAVFLVGCAVGGGASQLLVPKASAQQAAQLTKWEYTCANSPHTDELTSWANQFGAQGWEMVTTESHDNDADPYCFKRPKM
jgi:hypothetical protein